MKTTVNFYRFERAFIEMGRAEQFSRGALEAIFDYIEEYEEDSGEEIEMDVVALCCEWSEYECAADAAIEYGWRPPSRDDDESYEDFEERKNEEALEWLEDRTTARTFDGGVVIVQF